MNQEPGGGKTSSCSALGETPMPADEAAVALFDAIEKLDELGLEAVEPATTFVLL